VTAQAVNRAATIAIALVIILITLLRSLYSSKPSYNKKRMTDGGRASDQPEIAGY